MERFTTHHGAVVWITECQMPADARVPTVLALTADALIVGSIDFRQVPQEIERLRAAADLLPALGKHPLHIPFASIRSVARYSQRNHLELRYQDGNRERVWQVYTPAYADLFETVHTWLAPGRPTRTEKIPISQVTPSPREGIGLFVMLLGGAGMFFWEESAAPMTNPLVIALYQFGRELGPVGRPLAGGLAVVLGSAWIIRSLSDRPVREMLEFRSK